MGFLIYFSQIFKLKMSAKGMVSHCLSCGVALQWLSLLFLGRAVSVGCGGLLGWNGWACCDEACDGLGRHGGRFRQEGGALGAGFWCGRAVEVLSLAFGNVVAERLSRVCYGVWGVLFVRAIFVAGWLAARFLAAEMARGKKRIGQDGVRPARFYGNYSLS